jgi:hypothetical protein
LGLKSDNAAMGSLYAKTWNVISFVSKHVLNVVVRSLSSSTIKILVVFDNAFSRTPTLLSSSALVFTGNASPHFEFSSSHYIVIR